LQNIATSAVGERSPCISTIEEDRHETKTNPSYWVCVGLDYCDHHSFQREESRPQFRLVPKERDTGECEEELEESTNGLSESGAKGLVEIPYEPLNLTSYKLLPFMADNRLAAGGSSEPAQKDQRTAQ
jgi:hypothetical protein